jgi:hypothetical protein
VSAALSGHLRGLLQPLHSALYPDGPLGGNRRVNGTLRACCVRALPWRECLGRLRDLGVPGIS